MAYLAVDKNGDEYIYETHPERDMEYNSWNLYDFLRDSNMIKLPEGTIEKIIGKPLVWENDPVEL